MTIVVLEICRITGGYVSKVCVCGSYRLKTPTNQRRRGGPHGLGDPDDLSLRKVEENVLIPKLIREVSRQEKCTEEVQAFTQCCCDSGLLMVVKCRNENNLLKECLAKWFTNTEFAAACKQRYLAERSEYRRTGITKKRREYNQSVNSESM
ncbi:COX assembly mitochondrial protein homolog isoform X2 [Athalia rosae]|uniref:COX assembly mitochondrial protein homolog isoform X2 n=1 Tax=Athalia rosae TaxID=37344 RepID=UPI002033A5DF|nr:COX assembly mitochondrial protein homolog isoform X2 [Athalia rosae]